MIVDMEVILDQIPRAGTVRAGISRGQDAVVYLDNQGALCILIQDVGLLTIDEHNLEFVNADLNPD